jgi:vacuolar-type H+-ATPase subunit H
MVNYANTELERRIEELEEQQDEALEEALEESRHHYEDLIKAEQKIAQEAIIRAEVYVKKYNEEFTRRSRRKEPSTVSSTSKTSKQIRMSSTFWRDRSRIRHWPPRTRRQLGQKTTTPSPRASFSRISGVEETPICMQCHRPASKDSQQHLRLQILRRGNFQYHRVPSACTLERHRAQPTSELFIDEWFYALLRRARAF